LKLSYRRFPRLILDTLIRAGYLLHAERHKPDAAMRAWDRLKARRRKNAAQSAS
jgi:hypothetical protein